MISLDKVNKILESYPPFRSVQVYEAMFGKLYDNWSKASNLPAQLMLALEANASLAIKSEVFESKDGKTVKALIYLEDGKCIETVLMSLNVRNSVCVSTQVGCPMGCTFCDSGRAGFVRNLTVDEIVTQIIFFARYLKNKGEAVTNIIYMGMGEPFLNYDNVINSIKTISDKKVLGLSLRRFSISTSGILPGIKKLSEEESFPVNLAISLHSAINQNRTKLMPVNIKYPLDLLSKSIKGYFDKTKRKVMYEYILLGGINTSDGDALALRDFISKTEAAYCVNLIPINMTDCGYKAPSEAEVYLFKKHLGAYKINYVQRYSFGQDIKAACGQLARRENV
jgi:23S rRNA (adenine2503-C2)-methyltransferase